MFEVTKTTGWAKTGPYSAVYNHGTYDDVSKHSTQENVQLLSEVKRLNFEYRHI